MSRYDVDSIHNSMLGSIPDTYQKSIAYPTWDLTRSFALAAAELHADVETALSKTDVENLTGEELERWCSQRKGISRKAATYAIGVLWVVTGFGTITAGDLFESQGGVQFQATETKQVTDGDCVSIQAVQAGPVGNVPAGSITRMPVTIPGIVAVTNAERPMTALPLKGTTISGRGTIWWSGLRPPAETNTTICNGRWK